MCLRGKGYCPLLWGGLSLDTPPFGRKKDVKPSALVGVSSPGSSSPYLGCLKSIPTLSVWPSVNPGSCVCLLILSVYHETGLASTSTLYVYSYPCYLSGPVFRPILLHVHMDTVKDHFQKIFSNTDNCPCLEGQILA